MSDLTRFRRFLGTAALLLWALPLSATPAADFDGDGDVDLDDLAPILAARNTPAAPGSVLDLDGDGTVTVLDARIAAACCTRALCAIGNPPTLDPVGDQGVDELDALTFTVSATDPDADAVITFSLGGAVPTGASIDPSSGAFSWTPSEAQGPGAFTFDVIAMDENGLSDTETITVTAREVNGSPALDPLDDRAIDENSTVAFSTSATDADLPANALSFSLDPTSLAAGMTLDAASGAFSWTPSEAQGPGVFDVSITVTDDGTPSLSGTRTFALTVGESNVAPTLAEIGAQSIDEGLSLAFTAAATDPDLPANALSFSLDPASLAAGMTLDPVSGAFQWTPSEAQGPDVFPVTLTVTDDGTPALTDSETFQITVNEANSPPSVTGETFDAVGNTVLELSGAPGTLDSGPQVHVTGSLLANDSDSDLPAQALSASLSSQATAGAEIQVHADGTFTYVSAPGDLSASDSFIYAVSDGQGGSSLGTVTIHLAARVWYVKNDASAPGLGTSSQPFTTLAQAEAAADAVADTIYVHRGDGTTAGMDAGITLQASDQRLIGEGVALTISGTVLNGSPGPHTLHPAGSQPHIAHRSGGDGVTVTDLTGLVIQGLQIAADEDAVEVRTTAANAASVSLTGNTLDGTVRGLHLDGSAGGPLTVFGFSDNSVAGTSGVAVQAAGVIFDADPSDADFDPVNAGAWAIGSAGDPVDVAGMLLGTSGGGEVSGHLEFSGLEIFAAGGAGLRVSGAGPATGGPPSTAGFFLRVPAGSTVVSDLGPAVDVHRLTADLDFSTLVSTNSPTAGVALAETEGSFAAGAASTLSGSAGPAFALAGGTVSTTFRGTITQAAAAPAVSITGGHAVGTVRFDTGTISATGGSGLHFDNADGSYQFDGPANLNGGDAGIDILNGSGGSFSFGRDCEITSPSGIAFNVDSSAATVDYLGSITQNNGATGVRLSASSGTVTFRGGLAIDSGTAAGLTASGGGVLEVCATEDCAGGTAVVNTISTSTATALSISGTTIGPRGLTFRSLSAGTGSASAGVGIVLENTGDQAGLTVTGTGAAGSGGTVRNKTGPDGSTSSGIGIFLSNTREVSLSSMQLNDFSNFAIRGTAVTDFTLIGSTIDGANGNSAPAAESSVSFENLLGTATFTDNSISGGHENNLVVTNLAGVLDRLRVTGGTIGFNSPAAGNDGILAEARGDARLHVTVSGVHFLGSRGDHIQANGLGTSSMDIVIQDNTFTNSQAGSLGGGVTISGGSATSDITMTYDISGTSPGAQTFNGAVEQAIACNVLNGSGTVSGTIRNNLIGTMGVPSSGSTNNAGILLAADASVRHDVILDNNVVQHTGGAIGGVEVIANGGSAVHLVASSNTIRGFDAGFAFGGLYAVSGGASVTDTASLCLHAVGNTVSPGGAVLLGGILLDQIGAGASYNIPGYAGPATGGATLNSFLDGQNTLGSGTSSAAVFNLTGAGTTCPP